MVCWILGAQLLFSMVFFTIPCKAAAPHFVETQQNVSAAIGRDAHLNCSVTGAKEYKVAWIGMAKGIVLSVQDEKVYDHPRVEIRHSSSSTGIDSFILTIKDVTHEDKGSFLCQVNSAEGLRKIYTLSIVVPPSIKDSSSSGDVDVVEGETARLVCRSEGIPQPTVTWKREDFSLIRISNLEGETIKGEELLLKAVDRTSSGAYLCIASNGVPPSVSKRIRLHVRFAPTVWTPSPFVYAPVSGEVNVSCVVDGFPRPEITWIQDSIRHNLILPDLRLSEREKFRTVAMWVNQSRFISHLFIRNIQQEDFKGYECLANNSEGTSQVRIILRELVTTTSSTTTTTTQTTTTSPAIQNYDQNHRTIFNNYVEKKSEAAVNRTEYNDHRGITTSNPQQSYFYNKPKQEIKKASDGKSTVGVTFTTVVYSRSERRTIYSAIVSWMMIIWNINRCFSDDI